MTWNPTDDARTKALATALIGAAQAWHAAAPERGGTVGRYRLARDVLAEAVDAYEALVANRSEP